MSEFVCKVCGKIENTEKWINGEELEKHMMCLGCNHWREQHLLDMTDRGEYGYAIIDGTHYVLCESTNADVFKGFGGRRFVVKFFDGEERDCNNLWCQGDIPDGYWRELMPDNAEFVNKNN